MHAAYRKTLKNWKRHKHAGAVEKQFRNKDEKKNYKNNSKKNRRTHSNKNNNKCAINFMFFVFSWLSYKCFAVLSKFHFFSSRIMY